MLEWSHPFHRTGARMFSIRQRFSQWFDNKIDRWPDFLGALMLVSGLIVFFSEYFGWSSLYIPVLSDLFLRIWPVLIGIGLAVIIIDNANEILRRREEKKRLILQMGSPEHAFAIEAVRQLRVRDWLLDGSLRQADLMGADLRGAHLWSADLREANLSFANLEKAYLGGADLKKANLRFANLEGANLEVADLKGANLEVADLRKANLRLANLEEANVTSEQLNKSKSLVLAIMPDGTVYKAKDTEENPEEQ